jgi:hypothetical protein
VAVAVEDVTWCGEIGMVAEEALDAVGLVEKGGGGVGEGGAYSKDWKEKGG